MNREIQAAVIGLLTVVSSPHTDQSGDDMHALVSDLFKVRAQIPAGSTPQAAAQAAADSLREPIQDVIACFLSAFRALGEINDAGQTEMSTADFLRDLALQWQEQNSD